MREKKIAEKLHTNPEIGTEYQNIIELARSFGFNGEALLNMNLALLEKNISAQLPVIVLIQAWAAKPVNYQAHWGDEHYVVAVGYDQEKFYFMDPYTLGHYTYIDREDFLLRWQGREGEMVLKQCGIIITREKGKGTYNPAKILLLE